MQTTAPAVRKDKAASVSLVAGICSISVIPIIVLIAKYQDTVSSMLGQALVFIGYIAVFVFECITPFIAIAAGIIALQRSRQTHQGHIGISIAGIVLGALILLPIVVFMGFMAVLAVIGGLR